MGHSGQSGRIEHGAEPLLIHNARVVTLAPARASSGQARRGAAMSELRVIDRGEVLIAGGKIVEVVPSGSETSPLRRSVASSLRDIDARGRVVMPGFVDCHTHMCWAGSRVDEWERRLAGAAYLDILKAGGGIMSTVRAVRAAGEKQLRAGLTERAGEALRLGSTTIEVKTGYGLSLEGERKMLDAIVGARSAGLPDLVPTLLLGHALDAEASGGPEAFVKGTIDRTLPQLSAGAGAGAAVDAFCEQGAWAVADCVLLLKRARELGHPVRVHTDQFNSLGMIGEAIELGARSVDHLEAATDADIALIGRSETAAVLLPCTGFHLDGRYARGRALVDAGAAVAIATNCNPGSAPCLSMPMAIGLAVRFCGLSVAEAIVGATINAASVLGLADRGVLAPGARGDVLILKDSDERALGYEFGSNPVDTVICGGTLLQA